MERYCSTGQSPQRAVAPMEEEEEVFNSSQADHQQTRTPNTRKWHTHAATYCVIIQTQRTKISGTNSNGTKHSGGPPEDCRKKKTETCRGFILTYTFL